MIPDPIADARVAELIDDVARREEAALARLLDLTGAAVQRLALRLLGDRHEAEEVTLDVFLQVWEQAERYRASRGSPLAWLLTIARSRAVDRLRSGQRRQRHQRSLLDSDEPVAPTCLPVERRDWVVRTLAALPVDQARVLELAYVQGYTQAQIAERLELPLGTVKTRARRGLQHLRTVLEASSRAPSPQRATS